MKVIATIFQCKRVSLPYLFIKYCVPKMRELSGFEFDVYLVQHLTPVYHACLETSTINGVEKVKKMTDEGKFEGAHIIQHSENNDMCPPLPSYKKGVEVFLREKGDLHIWLEDDALIMDKNPRRWLDIKDVGTYIRLPFVPVRHTITTRAFDERMLQKMNTEQWDASAWGRKYWFGCPLKGHPEYFMTECCKKKLHLKRKFAVFHHDGPSWKVRVDLNFLKEFIPQDELKILDLDFK